jgi:prepilin-type N-terminal cleavage/methylation domain-containing protein
MKKKIYPANLNGYSLIELLVVMAIILVMLAISLPYIFSYESLYKSEEQSLKIMDLMREASQRALSQRRAVRLEVDVTLNEVHIIDEESVGEDTLVKSQPVENVAVLRMDLSPSGINRPNPPNYPAAVFQIDDIGHSDGSPQPVIGNRVWAVHFRSDGAVVNQSNIPVSATLFIYPPTSASSNTAADPRQVRAITIYGGSGAVRYWKYNGTRFYAG